MQTTKIFSDIAYFSGFVLLTWNEYLEGDQVKSSTPAAINEFEKYIWK